MAEINNYSPVIFDEEAAKKRGAELLQSYSIPDTSDAQKVLLYARIVNNEGDILTDLDASMFDHYERVIFEAIKSFTGGSPTKPIINAVALLNWIGDTGASNYLFSTYNQESDYFSDVLHVVGVDGKVRIGDIERYKKELIEAANKRKTLEYISFILNAKDAKERARYAQFISHLDNTATGEEFKANQTFERRKYLFKYQGAALAQTHNFYTIMGAQKSGKSHVFSVLLSAVLYGKCCGFEYVGNNLPEVLYIDTEQDITDAQDIIHTANILNNKPVTNHPRNLHCFTLAHTPREKVFDFIAEKIEQYTPQIVFIDGYGGLVQDVNDPKCFNVVYNLRILAQTKGCSIFGIVHTTPTAAVLKALGVFGSELQRWGAGTFLNEKQEGFYKLSAFELRKGGDVDPFYYTLKTCIVDNGKASELFEYCELEDQLNRIDKHQNEVEILAIPTAYDEEKALQQEAQKKAADEEAKRVKKRMKDEADLRAKFSQIFEGDENKSMTKAILADKYAVRFGKGKNTESDKRTARNKIDEADLYEILIFDNYSDTYRYNFTIKQQTENGK